MAQDGGSRADTLFQTLLDEQASEKRPPVDQWQPERSGSIDIRIARDGTWYHEGSPIQRAAMVKLFSTILRRDGDDYFLVTPVEKLAIEVEDAPFQAVALTRDGEGPEQRLLFTTNVGDHVLADAEHQLNVQERDGEPSPYVHVRNDLWALLSRNVFYELVELGQPDPKDPARLAVRSCGTWFDLGRT